MESGMKEKRSLNTSFVILMSGQSVSQIGSSIYYVVLMLFLKQATSSASVIGLNETLALLPAVVLGPLVGTLADHWNRKRIIVASDLIRGLLMMTLGCVGLASLPFFFHSEIKAWTAIAVTFLVGIADSLFNPTIQAALPDIVPEAGLKSANSVRQIAVQLSVLIGQGIGGVLFAILGFPLVLILNGISYLTAAIASLFITVPRRSNRADTPSYRGFFKETKAGLAYIIGNKGLRSIFLLLMIVNLLTPPLIISFPFLIEDLLKVRAEYLGFMFAVFMVGGIIGYVLYGAIKSARVTDHSVFFGALLLVAVTVSSIGLLPPVPVLFALCAAIGFSIAVINVILPTAIQRTVPSDIRGRVFGSMGSLSTGLVPVGYAVGGLLVSWFGPSLRFLFPAIGAFIIVVFLAFFGNSDIKSFMAEKKEGADD
jgi:MFS transporter, DHA3 family, macrolide efflux protein